MLWSWSTACKRRNEWVREKEEEIFRGEEVPFSTRLPPTSSTIRPRSDMPDVISTVGSTITLLNDGLVLEDTLSTVTRQGMVL